MPTYAAPGVYVEEVASTQKVLAAAPTAVTAFVGFTERFPTDDPGDPEGLAPRLVTSWSQFEASYGGFTPGAVLPLSVYGYFANGGALAYIVRVPNTAPSGEPSRRELPAADRALGLPLAVESLEPDADLTLRVTTQDTDEDGPSPFTLDVLQGLEVVESFPDLTLGSGKRNVATVVNDTSTKIKVEVLLESKTDLSGQLELLKPGLYPLEKAAPSAVPVTGRRFAGSESSRQGINGLAVADDVTIVVVPDLITAATKDDGTVDLNLWKAVQTALISHCEQNGNRMAVLDAPPGMTPQQIRDWRSDVAMYDSPYAALYYPWIKVENPIGVNGDAEVFIPPSGHIAGVWARTDETRGVWKAPANDTIRGCLDVAYGVTQNEQAVLNPIGINCIRPFGTRGIRIWGARTLASDSDWRYINVRRLFNMVEKTIADGTQWAVFEPNDVSLWEGIKRTLNAFLRGLWSAGALFGQSVDQAFYVKCDAENNPPESIDQGLLIVEVGIAPVKPAEFVVFRIAQHKQVAN
ncbi:phage tail sheath family protein [Nakamurella multipartita]|jgi:phage tail sheath protein FI|uniref:Tail sheath protein n=1 Tax=Nakamurella multipartita (strain ATCC 700099 / DSM 44233 / CIP 104796 / JCM 9543 / NBRC 105858 / Y-104) TaxID=479431 RepID=C8XBK5_NAKMY|nr:phage tail sheath subtilisin-like domain-containing protein [Nakamurella multipartita]ACV77467.1 tail sheath protein [Nakamurella multipartita DSM 44233]